MRKFQVLVTIYPVAQFIGQPLGWDSGLTGNMKNIISHQLLKFEFSSRSKAQRYADSVVRMSPNLKLRAKAVVTA